MFERTDIDHLHDVIMGRRLGRQQGYTHALCCKVVGHLLAGKADPVVVQLKNKSSLGTFLPILGMVMAEQDVIVIGGSRSHIVTSAGSLVFKYGMQEEEKMGSRHNNSLVLRDFEWNGFNQKEMYQPIDEIPLAMFLGGVR